MTQFNRFALCHIFFRQKSHMPPSLTVTPIPFSLIRSQRGNISKAIMQPLIRCIHRTLPQWRNMFVRIPTPSFQHSTKSTNNEKPSDREICHQESREREKKKLLRLCASELELIRIWIFLRIVEKGREEREGGRGRAERKISILCLLSDDGLVRAFHFCAILIDPQREIFSSLITF